MLLQKESKTTTNIILGVSEIMESSELKDMTFHSRSFEKSLDLLSLIDTSIEKINSEALNASSHRFLQQMKWQKLELKKFLSTEISNYSKDPKKWIAENDDFLIENLPINFDA